MEISSNPFLEEDIANDSVASTAAPTNPGLLTDRISYEEISKQLINDSFVLTALELHTELQEIGKPVAYLRDYFSNPGNFERTKAPELQSTSPPVGLRKSLSITLQHCIVSVCDMKDLIHSNIQIILLRITLLTK